MHETIGNQQERLPYEVAYLFGVIDGEGSYQLVPNINKQKRRYFSPQVTISNANPKIIDLCAKGFNLLGCSYHIWTPQIRHKEKFPLIRIYIKGIKRMKKFLDIAVNIDHAKLPQAKVIKEFVDKRLSTDPRALVSGHELTYGQEECDLKNKLSQLNKEFNSRGRILRDYTLDILKVE